MEKFLDKIDSYKIMNNLLPGIVLCFLCERVCGISIVKGCIIENLFIYYFIGMVASRIGSVIVEPVCKKLKLVTYAEYGDFLKAKKIDKDIDKLSETNNSYRTIFATGIIVVLGKIWMVLSPKFGFSVPSSIAWALLVTVLFGYAYRKQTQYVVKRVEKAKAIAEQDSNIRLEKNLWP